MVATVGVEQIASALDITARRVQQLVAEGLPQVSRGKYELGACFYWYVRYQHRALAKRSTVLDAGAITSLTAERTRAARAMAEKMERENAQRAGLLIEASAMESFTLQFIADFNSRVDGAPGRLAQELASLTDPALVRERLLFEFRAIRAFLAARIGERAKRSEDLAARTERARAATGSDPGPVGRRKSHSRKAKRGAGSLPKQ